MTKMHKKISLVVDVAFNGPRCGTYKCAHYVKDQGFPRCTLFQTDLGYVNNEGEAVEYPHIEPRDTFNERLWAFIQQSNCEARCSKCLKEFGQSEVLDAVSN